VGRWRDTGSAACSLYIARLVAHDETTIRDRADRRDHPFSGSRSQVHREVLCVWHKQPWPYFFVFLIPTLFVIQAPLLAAVIARLDREGRSTRLVAAALAIVFGVVLPVGSRLPATLARSSDYQQSTFRLADAILRLEDRYLAGVPMLFRRTQAVPKQFNLLDSTERARIAAMPIAKILSVIQQLSRTPTRLVILNYRLSGLPQPLNLYLRVTFEPYWGSIFIYSPRVGPGHFDLAFDGAYLVKSYREKSS
jgi:hypothetical protein